jgi:hypothetical protein
LSTKEPVTDSPDSFAPLAFGHGWEKEYAKIAEVGVVATGAEQRMSEVLGNTELAEKSTEKQRSVFRRW